MGRKILATQQGYCFAIAESKWEFPVQSAAAVSMTNEVVLPSFVR